MPFTLIRIVLVAACCAVACRHFVHMLQLESYQLPGYRRWMSRNRDRQLKNLLVGLVGVVLSWYLPVFFSLFITERVRRESVAKWVMLALFVAVTVVLAVLDLRAPAKKPLVFTRRVRRLYGFIVLLCLAGSALLSLISLPPYLLYAGNCYIVMGAAALAQPLENRINGQFFERARKKLEDRPDLIKIGITGSYGKTSTKFVLRDILSQKYRVLATPASFNTPMGLSRVINEQLKGEHQIFIAEMGARHVGDIKELCELVHPKYGLLTSVGPQHLETFGSIENIAGTKYELIEALPKDGIAFFSSDGSYVDRLFAKCEREKYRVGFNPDRQPYMLATDIEVGPQGSRFTLKCADGESLRCRTRLLGRHNIQNIALCAAVARKLGLTMEEIARGVRIIEPIEHRLQLIPGAMTVIDDAFNSNPAGSQEALNVLSGFPGRRIIVTPGMVEQGAKEDELNYAFGTQMVNCVDVAILVGPKHTKPIRRAWSIPALPATTYTSSPGWTRPARFCASSASRGIRCCLKTIFPTIIPSRTGEERPCTISA